MSDPVLRDEFLDLRGGGIVGTCEHIGKVSLGIDFGLSAVFDQSEHDGRSGPGIGGGRCGLFQTTFFDAFNGVFWARTLVRAAAVELFLEFFDLQHIATKRPLGQSVEPVEAFSHIGPHRPAR